MKVRIKSLPKSENGSQVNNKFQGKQINWPGFSDSSSDGPKLKSTLAPVARHKANVEAEKGEVAIADMNFDGIPEHFVIGGQRHHSGGTPLNLPPDSFIFSDTQKMKIKDKEILSRFGLSKGSYTPADIAKKYNINKYRGVLYDKDADRIQHESAEKMIQNYNQKLGELALIQESKKGFPQGIPTIAMPYLETHGIDPQQFLPQSPVGGQPSMQGEDMAIQDGMEQQPMMRWGGFLPKAQMYNSQIGKKVNLGTTNYQLPIAKKSQINEVSNSTINTMDIPFTESGARIINEYDNGLPNDTSYMYMTPYENFFNNTGQNSENKKPILNYTGPNTGWMNPQNEMSSDSIQMYIDKINQMNNFRNGGYLPKFQTKGEVQYPSVYDTDEYKRFSDYYEGDTAGFVENYANNRTGFNDGTNNDFETWNRATADAQLSKLKSPFTGPDIKPDSVDFDKMSATERANFFKTYGWIGQGKEATSGKHYVPGTETEQKVKDYIFSQDPSIEEIETFQKSMMASTDVGELQAAYNKLTPIIETLSSQINPFTWAWNPLSDRNDAENIRNEFIKKIHGIAETGDLTQREAALKALKEIDASYINSPGLYVRTDMAKDAVAKKKIENYTAEVSNKVNTLFPQYQSAVNEIKSNPLAYDDKTVKDVFEYYRQLKNATYSLHPKTVQYQMIHSGEHSPETTYNKLISTYENIKSIPGEVPKLTVKEDVVNKVGTGNPAFKFIPGQGLVPADSVPPVSNQQQVVQQSTAKPLRENQMILSTGDTVDIEMEKFGGQLRKFVTGGTPDAKPKAKFITINGKKYVQLTYPDRIDISQRNANGKETIISSSPINRSATPTAGTSSTASTTPASTGSGSEVLNAALIAQLADKFDLIIPSQFTSNGKLDATKIKTAPKDQHYTAGSSNYGNSGDIDIKETKRIWKDYFDAHPDFDPEAPGFNPKDLATQVKVKAFQDFANAEWIAQTGKPYFDGSENFGAEGLWGPITANVPRVKKRDTTKPEVTPPAGAKEIAAANVELPVQRDAPNEWWLQDKNNLGFAMSNLAGIKRYPPWNATPDNMYQAGVFYDPTRALAANSEMVNQGIQGAVNFSNPQAFAANFSQMQGQGATQAANIVGNYADRNVGVANQLAASNTASYNQFSREKANLATNLFDKYTTLNQQHDNSRNQAREQIVAALNKGYTNAGMTQNLNSIYPNFNIDAPSGGNLEWLGAAPLTASNSTDEWEKIKKRFKEARELDPAVKLSDFLGNKMQKEDDNTNPYASYLPASYG